MKFNPLLKKRFQDFRSIIKWGEVSEKPDTFPPTDHAHAWDSISGKPDLSNFHIQNTDTKIGINNQIDNIADQIDTYARFGNVFDYPNGADLTRINHSFTVTARAYLNYFAYYFTNVFNENCVFRIYDSLSIYASILYEQSFVSPVSADYGVIDNIDLVLEEGIYRWEIQSLNNLRFDAFSHPRIGQNDIEGSEWYNGQVWGYMYRYKLFFEDLNIYAGIEVIENDIKAKGYSFTYNGKNIITEDEGGKVPLSKLPSTLLVYKGVWNAATNTPALLATDTTKAGQVYNVGTAGTQHGIVFNLGDWAIYNDNGILEKSDNSDDVVSVNGKQGNVTLSTTDVAEGSNLYFTNQRAIDAISGATIPLKTDFQTGLTALNKKVWRDFFFYSFVDIENRNPIHVRFNLHYTLGLMYRFSIEGYHFADLKDVSNVGAGYLYTDYPSSPHNMVTINNSLGLLLTQYYSADGYLCFKLENANNSYYYVGFVISAMFFRLTVPVGFQVLACEQRDTNF